MLKLLSVFRVICNNLSDCGFNLIKLIWDRSWHMFEKKM